MAIKQAVKQVFEELVDKGEILKAQNFINYCIPLELNDDPQILNMATNINTHIQEIQQWSISGRPYPGTHATIDFNLMSKFVLAKKKILDKFSSGMILDVGCYSGVFMLEMIKYGFNCCGIDIHRELMDFLDADNLDKRLEYKFGTSENIPYSDVYFDIVVSFDTLEHVIDFDKSVREMERVCKPGGLMIVNLPRITPGYVDDSHEHLRMFSDEMINEIWGKKDNFEFSFCTDELGRPTSFVTYINRK